MLIMMLLLYWWQTCYRCQEQCYDVDNVVVGGDGYVVVVGGFVVMLVVNLFQMLVLAF